MHYCSETRSKLTYLSRKMGFLLMPKIISPSDSPGWRQCIYVLPRTTLTTWKTINGADFRFCSETRLKLTHLSRKMSLFTSPKIISPSDSPGWRQCIYVLLRTTLTTWKTRNGADYRFLSDTRSKLTYPSRKMSFFPRPEIISPSDSPGWRQCIYVLLRTTLTTWKTRNSQSWPISAGWWTSFRGPKSVHWAIRQGGGNEFMYY